MALVTDGFELTVSLIDTSGSVSTLSYQLTSADYATALTDAGTIITALDDVTNSTVSNYRVVERFVENAFTLPANAENAIKAEINAFIDGEGTKKATFRIPAPANAIFVAANGEGYNIVDTSNAEVLAYTGIFEVGTGEASISDGEFLVAPVSQAINKGRRVSVYSRNP